MCLNTTKTEQRDCDLGTGHMRKRSTYIVAIALASVFLPMCIGALRGVGLSRAADGNQSFDFARSYYKDVFESFSDYTKAREKFSDVGWNMFGLRVYGISECQEQLNQTYLEEDQLVSAALSSQRSLVLEGIFDQPGVAALEDLPSPIVGALAGCRYTFISPICTMWSKQIISNANKANIRELQREKRLWLQSNEAASCKASDKFGAKKAQN